MKNNKLLAVFLIFIGFLLQNFCVCYLACSPREQLEEWSVGFVRQSGVVPNHHESGNCRVEETGVQKISSTNEGQCVFIPVEPPVVSTACYPAAERTASPVLCEIACSRLFLVYCFLRC